MKHVYLIGSKGIPALYGGFEAFVDRLTAGRRLEELTYHVACLDTESRVETVHSAECFHLKVPKLGPARAVLYDLKAFRYALSEIKEKGLESAVIYVLACRIGPFFKGLTNKAHKLGAVVAVNPDGHEFLRAKWNGAIQKYWKYSESLMVKSADLMICDAKEMERYIRSEYADLDPKTCYIPYGADVAAQGAEEPSGEYTDWLRENGLSIGKYALTVGRFVPENNYECMIREYMRAKTLFPLALVTNAENNRFYQDMKKKLHFEEDDRIRFVGTVYDRALLTEIRRGAAFSIHGHEVGGTNPTLLEALGSTDVNLLLDVPFNREVGEEAALYWSKEEGALSALIDTAGRFGKPQRLVAGQRARARIRDAYSWDEVIQSYEKLFLSLPETENAE